MSAYFETPRLMKYNDLIMQESSVRFALALCVIVGVLLTSDILPSTNQKNKWIVIMNKSWVRLVMIALCLYYLKAQPTVSFIIASVLLMSIHWYTQLRTAESFVALSYVSENNINNACSSVTSQQLLDLVNGDAWALQRLARMCGAPPGLNCSDDANSAYIGSLLLQSGISVTDKCSAQQMIQQNSNLHAANSTITVPIIATPTTANVTPVTSSLVSGGTTITNGMGLAMIAAEQIGTTDIHLSSLY